MHLCSVDVPDESASAGQAAHPLQDVHVDGQLHSVMGLESSVLLQTLIAGAGLDITGNVPAGFLAKQVRLAQEIVRRDAATVNEGIAAVHGFGRAARFLVAPEEREVGIRDLQAAHHLGLVSISSRPQQLYEGVGRVA